MNQDTVVLRGLNLCTITLYYQTIITFIISVRDSNGKTMWQKTNCTCEDLGFAVEITKRELYTDVFEN